MIGSKKRYRMRRNLIATEVVPDFSQLVQMSPEAIMRAKAMRQKATQFGDMIALLLKVPQFQGMPLSELEWLVLPALRLNQYLVMEAEEGKTGVRGAIAAALWAKVNEEVEARLVNDIAAKRSPRLATGLLPTNSAKL
jgi:hemolysin-activating ACP:hemolysin acyltransferase